jgi:hypothetical protein
VLENKEEVMDTTDKIAIVNTLMQEDRTEIRMNKSILLNSSYFVVSGIIAITAFAISQQPKDYSLVSLLGIWSLFLLYIATFVYFKNHLRSLRRCLDIREGYYKDFSVLENEEPFNPLKPEDPNETPSLSHNYLYYLPAAVILVAVANTAILKNGF